MHYRVLKGSSFRFSSLRRSFSSGGSLDDTDAEYFFRKTGVEVTEVMGSTETGGIAYRLNSGAGGKWNPFDNVEWKISEERLLVNSEFISKELLRDDESFFTTGDRASYDGEKSFKLLGRADGVVKVAGKRVDLSSVQKKIKQISGVEDAVVISLPSPQGRENIIAAIVEGNAGYSEIKKSLSKSLEHYEVPRRIKIIDKIPRTPAGKYDRLKITEILKSASE
jgi:acyl-coenzyme A synthetase/AMP-(fatty) acid ligase